MRKAVGDGRMVNKTVRFPLEEYEMLVARAADERMSFAAYVRMMAMLQAGGFDPNQQALLKRLDSLIDALSRVERLSAISVASAAVPKTSLPSSLGDAAEEKALQAILAHVRYAGGLSDSIVEAVQNKKL